MVDKDWCPCVFEGCEDLTEFDIYSSAYLANTGSGDPTLTFGLPQPVVDKNGDDLNIDKLKVSLKACDNDDYIDKIEVYKIDNTGAYNKMLEHTTDIKTTGEHDIDISGSIGSDYKKIIVVIYTKTTTNNGLAFGGVALGSYEIFS